MPGKPTDGWCEMMRSVVFTIMVAFVPGCGGGGGYVGRHDGGVSGDGGAVGCQMGSPVDPFLGWWTFSSGWFSRTCTDGTNDGESMANDQISVDQVDAYEIFAE